MSTRTIALGSRMSPIVTSLYAVAMVTEMTEFLGAKIPERIFATMNDKDICHYHNRVVGSETPACLLQEDDGLLVDIAVTLGLGNDEQIRLALAHAAEYGESELMPILIKHPRAEQFINTELLNKAAREGNLLTFQHFINHPNVKITTDTLIAAIRSGDEETVEYLLGTSTASSFETSEGQMSPMEVAANLGNILTVRVLLNDKRIKLGLAFELAVARGWMEVVKCLLGHESIKNNYDRICGDCVERDESAPKRTDALIQETLVALRAKDNKVVTH